MINFLKTLLFYKPRDRETWVSLILLWILSISILVIIGVAIYFGINFISLDKNEGTGILVSKSRSNAYYSTSMVVSGKIIIPINTYHPAQWYLHIQVNNKIGKLSVSFEQYNNSIIGNAYTVDYKEGRIDNDLVILNLK